jgi:putative membrane protein
MSGGHWHPEIVAGLEAVVAGYLLLTGPLRRRRGWGPPPTRGRLAAFLGGTALLAAVVLGPVAEWAERAALSAHMLQHLVLMLVVPPLWLAGLPDWLWPRLTARPRVRAAGLQLTRPIVTLLLASAVQAAWHVPVAFEAALRADPLHALEHLSFLGTGLLFWWPVLGTAPAWPRPTPPGRLLYLFLATIPMMAIAAPITLAEDLLYPAYAAAPVAWPLPPAADQVLAGVLMWVGGSLVYLAAATVVFFRWAWPETREDGEPSLVGEVTAHGR